MKSVYAYLSERTTVSKHHQYKEGTFGYWWTVIEGKEDINGQVYEGAINCSRNNLTSLEGAPKVVNGHFDCNENTTKFTEEDVKKVSKVTGVIFV